MLQTRKICARQHPACPAENKIVIIMKERKKEKKEKGKENTGNFSVRSSYS